MISARKIAWEISTGKRKIQFIGAKSFEVLQQEIFSLKNRYNPETMTNYENYIFEKNLNATMESVLQLDNKKRFELYQKVDEMFNIK